MLGGWDLDLDLDGDKALDGGPGDGRGGPTGDKYLHGDGDLTWNCTAGPGAAEFVDPRTPSDVPRYNLISTLI